MNHKKRNYLDTKLFFKYYPYIKFNPKYTRPYIPVEKRNDDHEYALDYKQWRILFYIYIKYIKYYLLSGLEIPTPSLIGTWRMYKYKYTTRKRIDFNETKKRGEVVYYKNNETMGYGPIFTWHKNNSLTKLTGIMSWKIALNRTFCHQVGTRIKKNPTSLLRLNEAPKIKGRKKIIKP